MKAKISQLMDMHQQINELPAVLSILLEKRIKDFYKAHDSDLNKALDEIKKLQQKYFVMNESGIVEKKKYGFWGAKEPVMKQGTLDDYVIESNKIKDREVILSF